MTACDDCACSIYFYFYVVCFYTLSAFVNKTNLKITLTYNSYINLKCGETMKTQSHNLGTTKTKAYLLLFMQHSFLHKSH